MASVSVNIHPNLDEIRIQAFPDTGVGPFHVLYPARDVSVFVSDRPVLDALQAALDEIRADMDAETAAVAS